MTIWLQKVEIDGHTVQLAQEKEGGPITGYSFSRGRYYPDPLKQLPNDFKPEKTGRTQADIEEEIQAIQTYPVYPLPDRKLRAESLDRFGIKTGLSMEDGETVTTLHFPYTKNGKIVRYKNKLINPKRFWVVGKGKGVDLFGWEQAIASGSPKLFIVEGELDVPATYQMLKDREKRTKWAHLEPAVVSVPDGASSAKTSIVNNLSKIRKHFKEIIYIPDEDEAGREAADSLVKVIPDIKIATPPRNDPCDCLKFGVEGAFCNAILFNASKPKNTHIIRGSSLIEAARKKPTMGRSYPWAGLTKLTRGKRERETRYWGAGVKMGKSEIVNTLAAHDIIHHDMPVLLVKPEEANAKTYQMLAGKVAGRIFHDPEIEFDEEAFDKASNLIGDKALIVDSYQTVNWDILREDIRYAVVGEGVKSVILDPITVFTNHMTTSDANEFLVEMAAEISIMTMDLDFSIDLFCHLKAPQTGEPHERGGKVFSNQFAGSRAMMRSCTYMIGMQGNKDPELPVEDRNMRDLILLEDRVFGNTGLVKLYWDRKTGLFNEVRI